MITQLFKAGTSITTDIMFLVVLFVLVCAYSFYAGKSRIISFILAFYPAQLLYTQFPFIDKLLILKGDGLVVLNKAIIFLIFFIPLNILISRYVFAESGYGGSAHVLRIAGFSLAGVVVFLLFSYSIVSLDLLYNFSPTVDALFSTPDKVFWWHLAPLLVLFVL